MPQCQLYEPFIGLEKEGKAPQIKYDMRAKHSISTLASIPIWLDYLKIKAEHLNVVREIRPLWEMSGPSGISDDALQREFLQISAGGGDKFGVVKNANLLECIDPLTIKWHSNTSILELIESFYAQDEKQREQDYVITAAETLVHELYAHAYRIYKKNNETASKEHEDYLGQYSTNSPPMSDIEKFTGTKQNLPVYKVLQELKIIVPKLLPK